MEEIKNNQFLSQEDFFKALEKIIEPIKKYVYQTDAPGINLGSSGAVYSQERANMEALIRPLWGLSSAWVYKDDLELREEYIKKIIVGVDPKSSQYWGNVNNYDQYIVEMAAISLALLLHKESFYEKFTKQQKQNLISWLSQALECKIPKNNWAFFKVLIRIALYKTCNLDYDRISLEEELALIDSMYVGNGWYVDGKETQKDYYIPFAFHYYGLIYATVMKEEDPERSAIFKERATLFAQDYLYYFDDEGEALPFGRSLTYRFAQASFFSALVFADVEAIPWSNVKYILSEHLKKWMSRSIFTIDGRMSIGYHYENMVMAEGYNAPGSPYWSLKTFLILAVPKNHYFWKVEPEKPIRSQRKLISEGNQLMCYSNDFTHLLGYPAGLMIEGQAHAEAKYSKFVYSSKFGFSVPKASVTYEEGAFDSTLAVTIDGQYYRTKRNVVGYQLTEDKVSYQWSPFTGVEIETEIYPYGQAHVRYHMITTDKRIKVREGGFSVPLSGRDPKGQTNHLTSSINESNLISTIIGIVGYEKAEIVRPEVNTSIFFPRSSFPSLQSVLIPGKHQLICIVEGRG